MRCTSSTYGCGRPCGTIASAVTVSPDPDLEERLTALLAGYEGVFHVDLAGSYLLDVNVRTHASLPVAVASGANVVSTYCDLLRGEEPTIVRGRPGLMFRWLEGDLRSIAWRVRDGVLGVAAAASALRPRRRTVHSFANAARSRPVGARLRYGYRALAARRS